MFPDKALPLGMSSCNPLFAVRQTDGFPTAGSTRAAVVVSVAMLLASSSARADEARPADAGAADVAPRSIVVPLPQRAQPAVRPEQARREGVAVVATGRAASDAWVLATQVYRSSLRPPALDEPHARVLAGEAPQEGAASELVDVAETRAAVSGEDAPSRRLLGDLAEVAGARALLVVSVDANGKPSARLFFAESRTFDAARYAPEPGGDPWGGTVRSIERQSTSPAPAPVFAKADAVTIKTPIRTEGASRGPFYTSGWFWGALGAAVFTGGLVYFATRSSDDTHDIPLAVRVPR